MSVFVRFITTSFASATTLGRIAIVTGLLAALAVLPFAGWWLLVHLVTFLFGTIVSMISTILKAVAPLVVLVAIGYAIIHD